MLQVWLLYWVLGPNIIVTPVTLIEIKPLKGGYIFVSPTYVEINSIDPVLLNDTFKILDCFFLEKSINFQIKKARNDIRLIFIEKLDYETFCYIVKVLDFIIPFSFFEKNKVFKKKLKGLLKDCIKSEKLRSTLSNFEDTCWYSEDLGCGTDNYTYNSGELLLTFEEKKILINFESRNILNAAIAAVYFVDCLDSYVPDFDCFKIFLVEKNIFLNGKPFIFLCNEINKCDIKLQEINNIIIELKTDLDVDMRNFSSIILYHEDYNSTKKINYDKVLGQLWNQV